MLAKEPVTPTTKQFFVTTESHPIIAESHSKSQMDRDAKHQLDNSKAQNRGAHSDSEVEQNLEVERRIEPRLSKYVRRHHPIEQIIGDKDERPMTRRITRSNTCLVSTFEPKSLSNALDNEDWISVMNE